VSNNQKSNENQTEKLSIAKFDKIMNFSDKTIEFIDLIASIENMTGKKIDDTPDEIIIQKIKELEAIEHKIDSNKGDIGKENDKEGKD
jgi:hypothetical protein